MNKSNKMKFSKEQKLKIIAVLLIALAGIFAGILELFSNCCCGKFIDGSLGLGEIILLAINILAVLVATFADLVGILTYSKTQEVKKVKEIKVDVICENCPYHEKIGSLDDFLKGLQGENKESDKSEEKRAAVKPETEETQAAQDKSKDDKNIHTEDKKDSSNKVFFWSVISTAISFTLLCLSVVVLAII